MIVITTPHNILLHTLPSSISFPSLWTAWAAKVPTVPVQMAVTSFGNQKGLIVCLDDSGGLSISYLGEWALLFCALCVDMYCVY